VFDLGLQGGDRRLLLAGGMAPCLPSRHGLALEAPVGLDLPGRLTEDARSASIRAIPERPAMHHEASSINAANANLILRIGTSPRRNKKLSQEELADRAEIHQTYLSGVERGKRNPSLLVLDRIAQALGTDVEELVRKRR
jgi:DNA-binding XRE family transcriptional regulator